MAQMHLVLMQGMFSLCWELLLFVAQSQYERSVHNILNSKCDISMH